MLVKIWIRNDSHEGSEITSFPRDMRYNEAAIKQYLTQYIEREYGEDFTLYDYQKLD